MITKAALEKSLKKNLTTIEPIAKDANKKTEVTQIPNSKGGVDMKIKSETADLYMDTQFAAAIAAGVAESLSSHLKLSQYDGTKMYVTAGYFTPLVSAGVYVILDALYAKGFGENFTVTSGGKATYTGTVTRWFDVVCSISGDSAAADDYLFAFFKNGMIVSDSIQKRTISGSGDRDNIVLVDRVELATNDYLEVHAAPTLTNPAAGVTPDHLVMLVR